MEYNDTPYYDLMLQALGSRCIAQTFPVWAMSSTQALADGNIRFAPIYIPKDVTVSSVVFFQKTAGIYTGNNYNGIGLYSNANGVLTLVASVTNTANLWTGSSDTYVTAAFTSPYAAMKGDYYLGFLFNANGTPSQIPAILGGTLSNAGQTNIDMPTGVNLGGTVTAQNTLPSTITMNGTITTLSGLFWGMLI